MPSKDRYHNEKFPSEKASSTRCSACNSAIVRLFQREICIPDLAYNFDCMNFMSCPSSTFTKD